MYNTRDMTNFKTANTALNLLTSDNEFNKCQTLFNTVTQLTSTNQETSTITYIKNTTALTSFKATHVIDKFKSALTAGIYVINKKQ